MPGDNGNDQQTQLLAQLTKQVQDLQLAAVRKDIDEICSRLGELEAVAADKLQQSDHEKRIRDLETASTRINTLVWLVTGGGILGVANFIMLLAGK
jgi:hypothetical protein